MAKAHSKAVSPAVPNIIACLFERPSGAFTKNSEFTLAYCEKPPKKTSPTLNPVSITLSPFLKFDSSELSTMPEKSIPGTKGNFLTILPPSFKISASLKFRLE